MAIFARYEALRKEIKALVAENEELKQLVLLLRENQELKSAAFPSLKASGKILRPAGSQWDPYPALPALIQQTLSLFFAASGTSSPKFAAPASPPTSLHPSGSRGYCHECAFPWHPHRPPSPPAFASSTPSPFLPCWPQPSLQSFPVAPGSSTHVIPTAFQAFGFGHAGTTPAQPLLPLAFWMGPDGVAGGGGPLVAAPVQSTLLPVAQGSQPPAALPQPPTPSPGPTPPPEIGKGESPAPEEALQPPQVKESSGSVQREANKQERIVGEVAFQLDRRILSSIFPDRLRLYGFTVRNIPEKISQVKPLSHEKDPFLQLSPEQSEAIMERYNSIMDSLKPLGYDPRVHPSLTERTVNTFGILRERPETSSPEAAAYGNLQHLEEVVKSVVPAEMLEDCLLLLNCLQKLSQEDGKPLFIW
uniref:Spermatosis and centriole associated 1 n=1 Tax=Naja naja TaxID=35670 RepID=A0A8C6VIK3_NAJNA